MTPAATRSFLTALRDIERRLPIGIPDRVRILQELEFDLEELQRELEGSGLSRDDARSRALSMLAPDRATLAELSQLHRSAYDRWTHRFGDDSVRSAERAVMALAIAGVVTAQGSMLLRFDLLAEPSRYLWPVLGIGLAAFALFVSKAFQLWIRRDHAAPGKAVGGLFVLGFAALLTGVTGALVDTVRLATQLERAPEMAGALTLDWVVRESALLSASILVALAAGLAWFALRSWVTVLTSRRIEALGLLSSPTRSDHGDSQ